MRSTLFPATGMQIMPTRAPQKPRTQKAIFTMPPTPSDHVALSSSKQFAASKPLLSKQGKAGQGRFSHIKTQAVLNPFAAARNPISEKDFDRLLSDLAPIAPNLANQDKKALFKKMIIKSDQLMAEVTQIHQEGKTAKLVVYGEGGNTQIRLPYYPQKNSISSPEDLVGCIAMTVLFSMLLSPQIVIGGPLLLKLEKATESAQRQQKDTEFYLKAFPKSKQDVDADFEAMQFSDTEKKQLRPTAKAFGQNAYRNNALRQYVAQNFDVLRQIGMAIASPRETSSQSPVTIGLMSVDQKNQHTFKDVTHLFRDETA
jgi:hypothetical protein